MELERNLKLDGVSELDLARFCLEPDPAESKRALAWVNSICLAFLIVGCLGLKPHAPAITLRPPPPEEAVPAVIEPLVTEVQTVTATSDADAAPGEQTPSDNAPTVAVTVDSPAVAFSVPTVGNLLVPLGLAEAPPPRPLQPIAPVSAPHIERIGVTGIGGGRPSPPYPEDCLERREQGRVLLFLEVDESGKITLATVKESSGHPLLDRATLEYVKNHWFFAPAAGPRQYEAPIVFRISSN
jgi:TonB family protein